MSDVTPVYVIAEVGVNHNGSLEMAKNLIDVAAEARVDAVKFQTFKAEQVISRFAPKAEYQIKTTKPGESQLEMLRKLELNEVAYPEIVSHCRKRRIEFMSSPFDPESVDLLLEFGISGIKIPSGEITNAPLLLKIAKTGLPLIMSTGMADLEEVERSLGVLAFGSIRSEESPSETTFQEAFTSEKGQAVLQDKVILLHCTSEYPAPFEDVNLRAMGTMKATFGLRVGYSDHTPGITIPIAAVSRGAVVIEKHLTLDKNLPGPDHKASLDPNELRAMVKGIRETELALGNPNKTPMPAEAKNKQIARKSLVAAREISKGEIFSEENLTAKRPGDGISPFHYWDLIGKPSQRDYQEDEQI